MMFINRNQFANYSYLNRGTIIEVPQDKEFYSTYNENMSSNIIPYISYLNADLDKEAAIKQNKGKTGIYRWINLVNNKIYIGSSIDLSRRFREYFNYNYITGFKRKFPIHQALLKYGYSNFTLDILEYCDKSELIKREQYYMDILKPEYNVLNTAGSNLGFKHSEATKELYRSTRLGRKRVNYLKPSKSEELTCFTDKKHVFSEATRLKLSANNHKSIPVIVRNTETGVITRFPSKSKAADFLGVSEATIRAYLIQQRTCKGYSIIIG